MATTNISTHISRAIEEAALRHMGHERSQDFVFYIDERPLPPGTWLGPRHAGLSSPRAVLVFVDEEPTAGFAHDCRYLLFDPATGRLIAEHRARFPPYVDAWPRTYRRFGPRKTLHPARRMPGYTPPPGGIGIGAPQGSVNPPALPIAQPLGQGGRRLAVFLAGMPDPATLNTMEFGYRSLRRLQYDPAHIRVANHLGHSPPKCAKWITKGITPDWDGADGQPFTMQVDHPGSRGGFCAALKDLAPKPQDSLFIHTGGHGEHDEAGSYLATTMGSYYAREFKADLHDLVQVGELVVVMQQCFSGGFRHAVQTCGAAPNIAFASAAAWNSKAYNDLDNDLDFAWNSFARDWFGAQNGGYYRNGALSANPDASPAGNADAHIDAVEAFLYARETPFAHPLDRPQQGYRSEAVLASKRLRLDGSHFMT